MKAEKGYQVFERIQSAINELKDSYGYIDDEFEVDSTNTEDKYLRDISRGVFEQIRDLDTRLEWLTAPVSAEGRLRRNSRGRYEIDGTGYEFTSGSRVDVYNEMNGRWHHSRIEHNGDDYYIVALGRDVNIVDVPVRLRRN